MPMHNKFAWLALSALTKKATYVTVIVGVVSGMYPWTRTMKNLSMLIEELTMLNSSTRNP
ncbi:hypothetical protein [Sulfolobus monocaudavirus SMV4]|uniref:hypothetical protein n=1 Tax=Sulfolobus monocaudavirus SMV4 TaxID=1732178 RepID=UPI0007061D99|nr:hypothetical protein AVT99_gp35 [Sulfolobus monocaudavirus SMV4]ALG97059.1 hypothetical protein [Sulfolobus monocaudavirus SMV4]